MTFTKEKKFFPVLVAFLYCIILFTIVFFLVVEINRIAPQASKEIQSSFSVISALIGFPIFFKSIFVICGVRIESLSGIKEKEQWLIVLATALLLVVTIGLMCVVKFLSKENFNRGEAYYYEGNYSSAYKKFTRSVIQNPKNVAAIIGLARTYEALGNTEEAIKHYLLGLKKQDKRYATYNDLARLYLENEENYHKALELLLRVERDLENDSSGNPDMIEVDGAIKKNIAWTYYQLGVMNEARSYIDKAISILGKRNGALNKRPGTFCLYALSNWGQQGNTYEVAVNRCISGKHKLIGAELKLYVDLKQKISKS